MVFYTNNMTTLTNGKQENKKQKFAQGVILVL